MQYKEKTETKNVAQGVIIRNISNKVTIKTMMECVFYRFEINKN